MKEYRVRLKGETSWYPSTYSGCDHYEAAEQFAEEYDSDGDMTLATGGQLIIEIAQYGTDRTCTVALYAETVVKYYSRDLNTEEREKHDV